MGFPKLVVDKKPYNAGLILKLQSTIAQTVCGSDVFILLRKLSVSTRETISNQTT